MFFKPILDYLIRIGTLLIILEPLWMLLPFAGFLYGSIFNLEVLKNSPYTICLLYFIFPVQTLMPVAIALIVAGFSIFAIGAFQIYSAKIRKSGMVKTGIYKIFRHPQYTGLILFSIGFLLIWGRFIAYIAFFLMIFLYYFLAKNEEKICLNQFGKEYEDYMKKTYFLFPGERMFSDTGKLFSSLIPQKPARIMVSFVLLTSIGIIACFSILSVRNSTWDNIPFSKTKISTLAGQEINAIMIEGFKHHIRGMNIDDKKEFFGDLLSSFVSSQKMKQALSMIDTEKINTLLCFLVARTVREKRHYYSKARGDIFVMLLDVPVELKRNNFKDFRKSWDVLGALEVNEFDLAEISKTGDPVKGKISIHRPFEGESFSSFKKRMEGIFEIYISGLKTKIVRLDRIIEK